jgi:hypothetical protein
MAKKGHNCGLSTDQPPKKVPLAGTLGGTAAPPPAIPRPCPLAHLLLVTQLSSSRSFICIRCRHHDVWSAANFFRPRAPGHLWSSPRGPPVRLKRGTAHPRRILPRTVETNALGTEAHVQDGRGKVAVGGTRLGPYRPLRQGTGAPRGGRTLIHCMGVVSAKGGGRGRRFEDAR